MRTLDILLTLVAFSIFLMAGKFKLHSMTLAWCYVVMFWFPGGSKYKKIRTEIKTKSKTKIKTVLGNLRRKCLNFVVYTPWQSSCKDLVCISMTTRAKITFINIPIANHNCSVNCICPWLQIEYPLLETFFFGLFYFIIFFFLPFFKFLHKKYLTSICNCHIQANFFSV